MMSVTSHSNAQGRIFSIGIVLLVVMGVFIMRLGYLQLIKHSQYQALADQGQNAKYELPAERGEVYLLDGDELAPLVLNETKFTLYADPRYVKKPVKSAAKLATALGGDAKEYEKKLRVESAYSVLEHRLPKAQADKVKRLKLQGIGLKPVPARSYPEGSLAAHVAGFVNDDQVGQYGIEQYFNDEIGGKPGLIDSARDVLGVPIVTDETIQIEPEDGNDIILTLDRNIQAKTEEALKKGVEDKNAASGSVLVLDTRTGAIKAMANYPTYNPAEFSQVENVEIFSNRIISHPYEPGSVIKPFVMGIALTEGVVTPEATYQDDHCITVDGYKICNTGETKRGKRTMTEIITASTNTGAVYLLEQLGGEDKINSKGKEKIYNYFYKDFRLGEITGIELAGESTGAFSKPAESSDVRYANMTFGQGISLNMLQVSSAMASVVNDGNYYQPYIVHGTLDSDGELQKNRPHLLNSNVISTQASAQVKEMMEKVVDSGTGYYARVPGHRIGGKTGSAEVAKPTGGYYDDRFIGSFIGYLTSDDPRYVIMVRVDDPKTLGYAGPEAAAPIFADIAKWLVEYEGIKPTR